MKKNIVFVIPSLTAGGAEKSLVNLLNTINYSNYNVDLVLLHKKGIFLSMLPKEVTVLDLNSNYKTFCKELIISCFHFLIQGKLSLIYHRILFFAKNKFQKNKAVAEQNSWQNIQKSLNKLPNKYDAAIGFLEKSSIYFTVDKIDAKVKIGWIHTTYSSSGMNYKFDMLYFEKCNAIIAVSPDCEADLKNNFPTLKNKFKTIYNIVSSTTIHNLSDKNNDDLLFLNSENSIVTVARLSPEKGIDLAVEASKILLEKNLNFKWFVIGDGQERENLEIKIKSYNLQNHFYLIGLKQNPYPYLKSCTLYVQPSQYEGKSMAIEEAKILCKPIIVTNFTTAKDQINNSVNGIIAQMNQESLANEILEVLQNKKLQEKLSLNLSKERLGTEDEINKLYEIINE
ncbi:glycosyltransferase [Flavobacterium sp.]|uniref:glycosyltransferase n=1 Tax=Flavobacterium sp. TaxID=239 RepID=UPI0037504691